MTHRMHYLLIIEQVFNIFFDYYLLKTFATMQMMQMMQMMADDNADDADY